MEKQIRLISDPIPAISSFTLGIGRAITISLTSEEIADLIDAPEDCKCIGSIEISWIEIEGQAPISTEITEEGPARK